MESSTNATLSNDIQRVKKGIVIAKVLIALSPIIIQVLLVAFIFVLIMVVATSPSPNTNSGGTQWKVSPHFPEVARKFLPIYQAAAKKYGVPWNILAGIHRVETTFSQDLNTSSVGAKGHTQFMDKTWVGWSYPGGTRLGDLPASVDITDPKLIAKYGGQGVDANGNGKADPMESEDAIYATAKYLASNHEPGEDWFARNGPIYQYNHDYKNYVLKVKDYAEKFAVEVSTGGTALASTGQFLFPVKGGKVGDKFGYRIHPIKKTKRLHEGIDITKKRGAPIMAVDNGTVVASRKSNGYGWKIIIQHSNGIKTLYAHMYERDVQVRKGQPVKKGQVIATIGSNGWSTGPHLHFEVQKNGSPTNPMPYLRK